MKLDNHPRWKLFFSRGHDNYPAFAHLGIDETLLASLSRWPEDGRPFYVNNDGILHPALNRFFASARMRNLSGGTNKKYAHALSTWVNFLGQQGMAWDDAGEEEILQYKFWRMTDTRNSRPVTGSTWSGDLAALAVFYDWSARHLGGPKIALSQPDPRVSSWIQPQPRFAPSYRPATVRTSDVKWLSPGAFRLWRDLGIHGMTRDGHEKVRWRPRSQSRDASFVEALYSSGLRLQECASLLLSEIRLPANGQKYVTQRLASACAKRGRGRPYWIATEALHAIDLYVETERASAIARAQTAGTYEQIPGLLIARANGQDERLRISARDSSRPRVLRIEDVSPDLRLRLFAETTSGLVPLQLFLNENGLPRPKRAWYRAFELANTRVAKAGVRNLKCSPHMLRHSFALRWYAVARLIWERRWQSERVSSVQDFTEQFGDSWSFVQTMLGHADVTTTRSIYLEPFRTLDVRALLEYGRADLDAETLMQVLKDDSRVRFLSVSDKEVIR